MTHPPRILLALCLAAAPLASRAATEVNAAAATINGSVVTQSEVDLRMGPAEAMLRAEGHTGQALKDKLAEMRGKVLQDLIDSEIILSEFQKMGGSLKEQFVDEEINRIIRADYKGDRKKFFSFLQRAGITNRKFREITRKRLIVQLMRSQVTRDTTPPTPEEVRAEYDRIAAKMRGEGGAIRISKIFLPRRTEDATPEQQKAFAMELRTKLLQGADFAALAKDNSQDAMASKGGDWGVMERKYLKKELADAAFATRVGGLTPVVEDETGFHIIKVEAKEPGKVASFEEMRDQATRMAESHKRAQRYEKYIEELRKRAVVRTFRAG